MGSPRSYRPMPQYVRGLPIYTADYPIMTLTLCTNLAMTFRHLQGPWHSTYLTASWVALALPGPCPGRWEACSSTRQTAHFMPLTSCATFTMTLMKWPSNLPIPPVLWVDLTPTGPCPSTWEVRSSAQGKHPLLGTFRHRTVGTFPAPSFGYYFL